MRRKVTFVFALCHIILASNNAFTQGMEDAKWWMGAKIGVGFTNPKATEQFTMFESLDSEKLVGKEYEGLFSNYAPSFAGVFTYSFTPNIALTAQPGYTSYKLGYKQSHNWKDVENNNHIFENIAQIRLHYFELPVMGRYEYSFGKLQAHLQTGGFYGMLLNGKYRVQSKELFRNNILDITVNKTADDYYANDLFITSNLGLIGGTGISIDLNFFRISLEANYRYGLNIITDKARRLEQQKMINSTYEIIDDISLQNLEFAILCTTPLDYLIHTPGMSGKVGKVRKR